ncbi:MAG: di-heme oxidoredictase family protein [Azospirillaceae bacterium]
MAAVLAASFLAAPAAAAGEPAPVPGDERAVTRHLAHGDIAAGDPDMEAVLAHGRMLFEARFTVEDGAGRPAATAAEIPTRRRTGDQPLYLRTSGPDATACAGCHNQPDTGGAGDFVANAFVAPQDIEWDFESVTPDLSMERGTTHMFGSGLLELVAREMTADLHALRAEALAEARATGAPASRDLVTKGVDFGTITATPDGYVDVGAVEGVHPDLIVKPFGQKASSISLRRFTVTAYNSHHGMQPVERFGARWTGTDDFDEDGRTAELTEGDITAAVLWQASLPPPGRTAPDHPVLREAARRGEAVFAEIGCASCHRPTLPLDSLVFTEPGSFNPAGTLRAGEAAPVSLDLAGRFEGLLERDAEGRWLVPAFTDLKRHVIADAEDAFFANELITQDFVPRDRFRTAPLWGVGSTAPYGHRGDLTTLAGSIGHHAGDARPAREAFEALSDADRGALIEFLETLTIDPAAGAGSGGPAAAPVEVTPRRQAAARP